MAVHHRVARKRMRAGLGSAAAFVAFDRCVQLAQQAFLDAGRRFDGLDG